VHRELVHPILKCRRGLRRLRDETCRDITVDCKILFHGNVLLRTEHGKLLGASSLDFSRGTFLPHPHVR
jgi:hypothetical protein